MKILYSYKEGTTPKFIDNSQGVQRVLLSFIDDGVVYVYFCDDYYRNTYLNVVLDPKLPSPYSLDNFKRIEEDSVFYHYTAYIENNYNYNGKHIEEKIAGHDLGGAVLINPLTGATIL